MAHFLQQLLIRNHKEEGVVHCGQKEILVAYGVDVDAVAGWLGSYGGEDSPDDISRGYLQEKWEHLDYWIYLISIS